MITVVPAHQVFCLNNYEFNKKQAARRKQLYKKEIYDDIFLKVHLLADNL